MKENVKPILVSVINDLLSEDYDISDIHECGYNSNGHEFQTLIAKTGTGRYSVKLYSKEGGEDCGSYYEMIFEILDRSTKETIYLMYQGDYNSWEGVDWGWYENPTLVEPYEKTIIAFREVA